MRQQFVTRFDQFGRGERGGVSPTRCHGGRRIQLLGYKYDYFENNFLSMNIRRMFVNRNRLIKYALVGNTVNFLYSSYSAEMFNILNK